MELKKGQFGLDENQIKSYDEIKEKINNKKGIYICPFGFWNYNIKQINYEKFQMNLYI